MKKTILFLLIITQTITTYSQVITPLINDIVPGSWFCFRNSFDLDSISQDFNIAIAADSKYWLWINGELQIREGGLKRGPNASDTYYDYIESPGNLKEGRNSIAVLVWYFGKEGYSHRNSPTPGITFKSEMNGNDIELNEKWKVISHPSFYIPDGVAPNYRLPESNIGYDANKEINFINPDFNDSCWEVAGDISLSDAGWNRLVKRPIPQWRDFGLKPYENIIITSDTVIADLPYNAQITPYLKIKSASGNKIKILTDNYHGGSAPNVFAEYITKEGVQEFECLGWMNGHSVIYIIPKDVEILDLSYRETGFDTQFKGLFYCDDPKLNTLWNKAQRTLYITMRDTYMDCPDRERAQWWGDVVNELGEAFYALDEKAHSLTRKGIYELMDWQRADSSIYSPVPSGNYDSELPMQMLASVGYYGFWTYYMGTGDKNTIEYVYPKVKKYIHLWKTDKAGFVIPRKGGWTWGDWGENKDMELLFNQWYIIALHGYELMSELVGENKEARWANATAENLKKAFHSKYWNGSYYVSSPDMTIPDDRAQALAIVSGTLPTNQYDKIRPFFSSYFNASPYMEKYVLEALCKMGFHQDALNRMKFRYKQMIESPLTTLWEGWGIGRDGFGGGTYNHAWSGGPLTIMSQFIAGIEVVDPAFSRFRIAPNPAHLNFIKAIVPLSNDREIRLELNKDNSVCNITLIVPEETVCEFILPDEYKKMYINGVLSKGKIELLNPGVWNILLSDYKIY